jgi:hypothetical protein
MCLKTRPGASIRVRYDANSVTHARHQEGASRFAGRQARRWNLRSCRIRRPDPRRLHVGRPHPGLTGYDGLARFGGCLRDLGVDASLRDLFFHLKSGVRVVDPMETQLRLLIDAAAAAGLRLSLSTSSNAMLGRAAPRVAGRRWQRRVEAKRDCRRPRCGTLSARAFQFGNSVDDGIEPHDPCVTSSQSPPLCSSASVPRKPELVGGRSEVPISATRWGEAWRWTTVASVTGSISR